MTGVVWAAHLTIKSDLSVSFNFKTLNHRNVGIAFAAPVLESMWPGMIWDGLDWFSISVLLAESEKYPLYFLSFLLMFSPAPWRFLSSIVSSPVYMCLLMSITPQVSLAHYSHKGLPLRKSLAMLLHKCHDEKVPPGGHLISSKGWPLFDALTSQKCHRFDCAVLKGAHHHHLAEASKHRKRV